MPLSELSRQQIIQKRVEAEQSASPAPEPEKKPTKKKERSIFAEEPEVPDEYPEYGQSASENIG